MPPTDEMGQDGQQALGEPSNVMPMAAAAPAMEDRVPLSALANADESNQMTTPAVGDRVSYSVDGKIIRIEGDQAFIQKESVNGQELKADAESPAEDSIEQLSADAGAMDQNQYD